MPVEALCFEGTASVSCIVAAAFFTGIMRRENRKEVFSYTGAVLKPVTRIQHRLEIHGVSHLTDVKSSFCNPLAVTCTGCM